MVPVVPSDVVIDVGSGVSPVDIDGVGSSDTKGVGSSVAAELGVGSPDTNGVGSSVAAKLGVGSLDTSHLLCLHRHLHTVSPPPHRPPDQPTLAAPPVSVRREN